MQHHRRTVLRWALKMGAMGFASFLPAPLQAMIKPGMKSKRGDVRINGKMATIGAMVNPGDVLTTGPGAEATLISGFNAYLIRGDGEIMFPEDGAPQKVLRIVSGQLLSVFGQGELTIDMPLATIGIRGTGIYVETWPERDYVCLCYGKARLFPKLEPTYLEDLETFHHDAPRNFHANPEAHARKAIEPAEMVNHTDIELIMLEALVGRIPLFGDKPIKMPKKKKKGN